MLHAIFMRLLGILLLATGYWILGSIAGYSTSQEQFLPIWLPAGISVAVCYRYGYWLLPGTLLGSLLLTQHLLFSGQEKELLLALFICTGAMLQTAASTWLLHARISNPLKARSEKRVLHFILYSGFIVSMIGASFSAPALHVLGSETIQQPMLDTWISWWLGDAAGIIIGTPLTLALLGTKVWRRTSRQLHRLVLLYSLLLLGIGLAHHAYLVQLDQQAERNFLRDRDVLHANLNRIYQQSLVDLNILERQYLQQNGLTAESFAQVAAELRQNNASIRAYSWVPLVTHEQKADFERRTRAELNDPDFVIYGNPGLATEPMIPVQYVYPRAENEAALGLNLLTLADRRVAILEAQETGRPTVTDIIGLAQAQTEPGLLIVNPVFVTRQTGNGQLSAERTLVGFTTAAITLSQMLDSAINLSHIKGIHLALSQTADQPPFYVYPRNGMPQAPFLSTEFTFVFSQQRLQISLYADKRYLTQNPTGNLFEFQILLMLLGAVSSGMILGVYNREKSLQHRVREQVHILAYQAEHDSLTGLPNRLRLEKDLKRAFDNQQQHHALLFIGLDRFKMINDSLGYAIGDRLLISLSRRLAANLDASIRLYRVGGDEFILHYPLTGKIQEDELINLARQLLELIALPVISDKLHLHVTASVGIAVSPDHANSVNSLIRNADTALHQAKVQGKNGFQLYQPFQTLTTRKSFELEQDMRLAINTPQFILHYQPQHRLSDLQLCGLEALVRWQHPELGLIPPGEFIALAEETHLILPLGWQVIDQVCRHINQWKAEGLSVPCIAINISPLQLMQTDFVLQLNQLVDTYEIQRHQLELEITETLLHQDPDFASRQLRALHLSGYRLALDDFGTGYSSFNRLKSMPLNRIKIDRSFVQDIGHNPKDEAIIRSIISLGKSLKIEVLAEGVETEQQCDYLRQQGCDSIQGYLMGRPVAQPQLQKAV